MACVPGQPKTLNGAPLLSAALAKERPSAQRREGMDDAKLNDVVPQPVDSYTRNPQNPPKKAYRSIPYQPNQAP